MQLILFFLSFYSLILFFQYWAWIKPVLLIAVSPANFTKCSLKDIPKTLRQQLFEGTKEAVQLGFQFSHYIKYQEFYASITYPKYSVVLFHPEQKCYVSIENNFQPDAIRPYNTTFHTFYNDEMFCGYYLENAFFIIQTKQCINIIEENLSKRFKTFIKFVEKFEKQKNRINRIKFDSKQHIQQLNNLNLENLYQLEKKSYLKKINDKFKFTILGAIKFGIKVKNIQTKTLKLESQWKNKLSKQTNFLIDAQTNAFQRNMQVGDAALYSKGMKYIVLVFSVLIFFLFFGSLFDFKFALILIPVLLLHELGHLLAMKLFNYRDLQMVFMPFGALAMGKNENVSVLKRVIVSLSGPIPGIILGFFIGLSPIINHYSWVPELAYILIVINYFNLLPFLPLDGGQIINHVLFARYPRLQLGFFTISVIGFILLAVITKEPVISVISLFLVYSLFYQFKYIDIYSKLNELTAKKKDNLIKKMFATLAKEPLRYKLKFSTVFAAITMVSLPKAKIHEVIVGLLLYFTALYAPIYGINHYTDGSMWESLGFKQQVEKHTKYDTQQLNPDYWNKKLSQNQSPSDKFSAYIQAMNNIDSDKYSIKYEEILKDALVFAKGNGLEKHRDYPSLLKTNIRFPLWQGADLDSINQPLLQELKQIDNGKNIEYARLILDITYLQVSADILPDLEIAETIFKENNDVYSKNLVIQAKSAIYIDLKKYEKAEYLLLGLIKSDQALDFNAQVLLIDLYQKNKQSDKAIDICDKYLKKEKEFGISSLFESCGWVELFNKNYENADDYFNQAAQHDEKEISSTIQTYINDPEIVLGFKAYSQFNLYQNLLVLEWSRNDTNKANEYLHVLIKLSNNQEELDIDKQIKSLIKAKTPSPKSQLIIQAYSDLMQSAKKIIID